MGQQGRHVLDFVKEHRAVCEAPQKTCGINRRKVAFERIVKTDVIDLRPGLVAEKRGLA